jgi:predicted phosphoribosyltransferase
MPGNVPEQGSVMPFTDRADAARQLASALKHYAGKHPLVLAIPRGAVPMGVIIARALGGDLDVVLVRKLGAPGNPEFAVGAVDESGWTYLALHADMAGADSLYLDCERTAQLELLRRRRAKYAGPRAGQCCRTAGHRGGRRPGDGRVDDCRLARDP